VRRVRPAVAGWLAAVAAVGLLLGLVAKAAGKTIAGSSAHVVLSRLGARGAGAAEYLGVAFLIVAALLAFVAAGQVTAARAEEAEGGLDLLLVRPVSRRRWYVGRWAVAAGALAACAMAASVATWVGAAAEGAGVGFTTLLAAGCNTVLPALLVLGVGGLALGAGPRAAATATYAVLGWSLLVEVVGGFANLNHWALDTSVFHQMAAAPAVPVDWTTGGVMAAIGVAAAAVGGLAFSHRDLAGE